MTEDELRNAVAQLDELASQIVGEFEEQERSVVLCDASDDLYTALVSLQGLVTGWQQYKGYI